MANTITKTVRKLDGSTFTLSLSPEPKSNTVNITIDTERPSMNLGGIEKQSASFKITREELTPLVMAFLMGG